MTMKELGMAVGFDENKADVRIAQYENNSASPTKSCSGRLPAHWMSAMNPLGMR